MNKFFIFLLLFFIGINSYAQQNQIQIIPVENGRVKGFSIISDTDTVKIDTMFYNIDKQYYNIDVMVKIIDGFEWSIKNVDAKVADKENELNKLMKKYYRMGYESGWDERYKSWDSSPLLYGMAGVVLGVAGTLIWCGIK